MDFTAGTLVTILVAIGLLALIVSVIAEVTKGVAILEKIPFNIQVIVLSLTLTLVAYFAYISYSGTAVVWYYVVADVIAGFVVAYVALYGWDKLADLYRRFRNIPQIDITADPIQITKTAASTNTTDTRADKESTASSIDTDLPVSSETNAAVTPTADSSGADAVTPTTDSSETDTVTPTIGS